jgi:hypothetical protein
MSRTLYRFLLTFFVVLPMTFLMSVVGALRTFGWREGFAEAWLNGWLAMLPVAYAAAFVIIPAARKLADRLPWRAEPAPVSSADRRG